MGNLTTRARHMLAFAAAITSVAAMALAIIILTRTAAPADYAFCGAVAFVGNTAYITGAVREVRRSRRSHPGGR